MTIALIAHDSKKELMVQFCTAYCRILSQHKLVGRVRFSPAGAVPFAAAALGAAGAFARGAGLFSFA